MADDRALPAKEGGSGERRRRAGEVPTAAAGAERPASTAGPAVTLRGASSSPGWTLPSSASSSLLPSACCGPPSRARSRRRTCGSTTLLADLRRPRLWPASGAEGCAGACEEAARGGGSAAPLPAVATDAMRPPAETRRAATRARAEWLAEAARRASPAAGTEGDARVLGEMGQGMDDGAATAGAGERSTVSCSSLSGPWRTLETGAAGPWPLPPGEGPESEGSCAVCT